MYLKQLKTINYFLSLAKTFFFQKPFYDDTKGLMSCDFFNAKLGLMD